jgi:hypothetical protein
MQTDDVMKLFQRSFDMTMSSKMPLDEKIIVLTEVFCGMLGHVGALMYFLDHNFYDAGDAGLETITDLMKMKITESSKRQMKQLKLLNRPTEGEA